MAPIIDLPLSGTLASPTGYMASRNPSHQSGSRRRLQTVNFRKAGCRRSAGPAIIGPASRSSTFAPQIRDSDQDVHTFKGRLLGVEDDLIDALIDDPIPHRLIGETPIRTSTGSHQNSQSNFERLKARFLGVEDQPIDAIALPAAQDVDQPTDLQAPGSPSSCHWHTTSPQSGWPTVKQCSNRPYRLFDCLNPATRTD
jgi:hypothetical protein